MILWIIGRVPSLNELLDAKSTQLGKWNRYNDIKASWAGQVKLAAALKKIGLQPPAYGTFLFSEPDQRRDPDNVVGAGVKLLLDSLVAAGVLGGDGWRDNLGYIGYWHLTPGRAGCLIHWGDEILTKPEMLAILEKEQVHGGREKGEAGRGSSGDRPRIIGDGSDRAHPARGAGLGRAKPNRQLRRRA